MFLISIPEDLGAYISDRYTYITVFAVIEEVSKDLWRNSMHDTIS